MSITFVTVAAAQFLRRSFNELVSGPEMGLRLGVALPRGLVLKPDYVKVEDKVIEYEGTKILLLDPEMAETLDESIIDVQDVDGKPDLVVIQGKATCEGRGCAEMLFDKSGSASLNGSSSTSSDNHRN